MEEATRAHINLQKGGITKMAELTFYIGTAAENVSVRNAVRVLNSLVVLRNALLLTAQRDLLPQYERQLHPGALDMLREVGAPHGGLAVQMESDCKDAIMSAFMQHPNQEEELQLISLKGGSIEGVLQDHVEAVLRRLVSLLQRAHALLPHRNRTMYDEELVALIPDGDAEAIIARGAAIVATQEISEALKEMRATEFTVHSQPPVL